MSHGNNQSNTSARAIARQNEEQDRRWVVASLLGVALAIAMAIFTIAPAMTAPQDTINTRVDLMKQMGGAMKALKKYAMGEENDQAKAKISAAKVKEVASKIEALFPKGTGIGDQGVTDSRALPAIWSDWPKFVASIGQLNTASDMLIAAAAAGSAGDVGMGLKAAGQSCGGCHKPFRKPK